MKTRIAVFIAIALAVTLLAISTWASNIRLAKAPEGCVTIRVEYADGYPRSNADVRKIWPEPIVGLGTTNESGVVTTDKLTGPQDYLVDAWYDGSQFGHNTGLHVDANGTGSTTIQHDYESIEIHSPENKIYEQEPIPLTFSFHNSSPIDWMGYSLDNQPNVTITGNTTLPPLSLGSHNVIVYANDTYGNMGSSDRVYFTVAVHDIAIIDISFSSKTHPSTKRSIST